MIGPAHVMTWGSTGEAAGGAAPTGGVGYYRRRRKYLSYILTAFLLMVL